MNFVSGNSWLDCRIWFAATNVEIEMGTRGEIELEARFHL